MKTIVNDDNISLWIFDNDKPVEVTSDKTIVGDPVEMYISDMRTDTCKLYQDVTPPDDWVSEKYIYTTDNGWTTNNNYVPYVPTPRPEESSS